MNCIQRKNAPLLRSVSFRLNEADYTRLAWQAAVANMRINELARRRVIETPATLNVTLTERTDPALIHQLLAIGNNLNQLVNNAHIFRRISPKVDALCERIERLIDAALDEEGSR